MYLWGTVYRLIYWALILILYLVESQKNCGSNINEFLLTEILMKIVIYIIVKGVNLILAKNSNCWMRVYKINLALSFVLLLGWNITLVVIFFKSTSECENDAQVLWVASIFVLIDSLVSLLQKCLYICWICCIVGISISYHNAMLRRKKRKVDEVKKSLESLKLLKPHPDNFVSGEDTCCICIEHLMDSQDLIELPCNKNHIFHFKWISEWLLVKQKCPIWKASITHTDIIDKINELQNALQIAQ